MKINEDLQSMVTEYVDTLKYPMICRGAIKEHFGPFWINNIALDVLEELVGNEIYIQRGKK